MKPVVVTIVCILILVLLSGVIFYKFAHDEIHKTTLKRQGSLGLGTLFNGLMIDEASSERRNYFTPDIE